MKYQIIDEQSYGFDPYLFEVRLFIRRINTPLNSPAIDYKDCYIDIEVKTSIESIIKTSEHVSALNDFLLDCKKISDLRSWFWTLDGRVLDDYYEISDLVLKKIKSNKTMDTLESRLIDFCNKYNLKLQPIS